MFQGRDRPSIVMYHRVADLACDPWGLAVTPANFGAQIALLRRRRAVLPLGELVALAQRGRVPKNAIALTFDDGYIDNLREAEPVLASAGLPATLFLASGPSARGQRYWWDELADLILDAPSLEGALTIDGHRVPLDLPAPEADDRSRRTWRAWKPRTARERLHYNLWERIRAAAQGEADRVMADLRRIFPAPPISDDRPMTLSEVGTLVGSGLFSLGGHTADHPDLTTLDPRTALDQILAGKEAITALAGRAPEGFAYPYGRNDARTRLLVEAAGFGWACTTRGGPVGPRNPRFGLPRIAALDVPDIDWLG